MTFLITTISRSVFAQQPEASDVPKGPSAEIIIDDPALDDAETVYDDIMPSFGRKKQDLFDFSGWVSRNLQYPMEEDYSYRSVRDSDNKPRYKPIEAQGRVVASFIVEKDGKISDITILTSPDNRLSDEVIRVLRSSPKWKPGTRNGEAVRVKFTLPVEFSLYY